MAELWASLKTGQLIPATLGGFRVRAPLFVRVEIVGPFDLDTLFGPDVPTQYLWFSELNAGQRVAAVAAERITIPAGQFASHDAPEVGFSVGVGGYLLPDVLDFSSRSVEFAAYRLWQEKWEEFADVDFEGDDQRKVAIGLRLAGKIAEADAADLNADTLDILNAPDLAAKDSEAAAAFASYAGLRVPAVATEHAASDAHWSALVRVAKVPAQGGAAAVGPRGKPSR